MKNLNRYKNGGRNELKTKTPGKFLLKKSNKEIIILIFKNPNNILADKNLDPEEILENIINTENKIIKILDDIKKNLGS